MKHNNAIYVREKKYYMIMAQANFNNDKIHK